jgi:hypothetical protein
MTMKGLEAMRRVVTREEAVVIEWLLRHAGWGSGHFFAQIETLTIRVEVHLRLGLCR